MESIYWILTVLAMIPSAWVGVKWLTSRTATKKDDNIIDKVKVR